MVHSPVVGLYIADYGVFCHSQQEVKIHVNTEFRLERTRSRMNVGG